VCAAGRGISQLDFQLDVDSTLWKKYDALTRHACRIYARLLFFFVLQALEEAVAGLEAAQAEGMRRLASSLTAALAESAQAAAAAARAEAAGASEQLRRLPALVAAATAGTLGPSLLSEATLRAVLAEQVGAAVATLAEQQRALAAGAAGAPVAIAPAQWNQLGAKLSTLDEGLEEVRRAQARGEEGAAAAVEAARQLEGARTELSTLASSVQAAFEGARASGAGGDGGGAEGRPAAAALEGGMKEATAAFSQLFERLEGFAAQLEALQRRLDGAAAAAAPPPPAQLDAAAEVFAAEAAAVRESAAKVDPGRQAAYQRMQAVLRGSGGVGGGDTATVPPAEELLEAKAGEVDEQATRLPISAWLSPDTDDGDEAEPTQQAEPNEAASQLQREALAVGAAAAPEAPRAASWSGGAEPVIEVLSFGVESSLADGNASSASIDPQSAATAADSPSREQPPAASPQPQGPPSLDPDDDFSEKYPDPEELQRQGLLLLRRGRAAAASPGGGWGEADAALSSAAAAFGAALRAAPRDVRALGNCGNALLARGLLKSRIFEEVRGAAAQNDAAAAAALEAEAEELLVLAGRRFKGVLELDPGQGRAFVNWGRAVCLRAELARGRGAPGAAAALFANAADKFGAAAELGGGAGAVRLAGTTLMCSALSAAQESDGAGAGRAEQLMAEAEAYLAAAAAEDPGDAEAAAKLQECRAWLAGG
jgi:hypothetical protein